MMSSSTSVRGAVSASTIRWARQNQDLEDTPAAEVLEKELERLGMALAATI